MANELARLLIILGILLVLIGGLILYFGNLFSWFGRLPGDIRIKRDGFSFYFPITTMLLISLVLNLIFRLIKYFTK